MKANGQPRLHKRSNLVTSSGICLQYFFGAAPATFEALDDNFAKGKNRVYFESHEIPEADPVTVGFLPREGFLIRDNARVYYQHELVSRDAGHFVKLGSLTGTYKSTDVVMGTYKVLSEADPAHPAGRKCSATLIK